MLITGWNKIVVTEKLNIQVLTMWLAKYVRVRLRGMLTAGTGSDFCKLPWMRSLSLSLLSFPSFPSLPFLLPVLSSFTSIPVPQPLPLSWPHPVRHAVSSLHEPHLAHPSCMTLPIKFQDNMATQSEKRSYSANYLFKLFWVWVSGHTFRVIEYFYAVLLSCRLCIIDFLCCLYLSQMYPLILFCHSVSVCIVGSGLPHHSCYLRTRRMT